MTRPCDTGHDNPVPPAVMVGTLIVGTREYPDTAYCRECIDLNGDEFVDGEPIGSDASQTSAPVDAPPEERASEVSAQTEAPDA